MALIPVARGAVVAAIGDSLTDQDWAGQLLGTLPTKMVKYGFPAQTTAVVCTNGTADAIIALNPALIILEAGTNDVIQSVPTATSQANLTAWYTRVRAGLPSVPIIALLVMCVGEEYDTNTGGWNGQNANLVIAPFNTMHLSVMAGFSGITACDVRAALGIYEATFPQPQNNHANGATIDGIHATPAIGQPIMGAKALSLISAPPAVTTTSMAVAA